MRRHPSITLATYATVAVAVGASAFPAGAQTLQGRVLEMASERPVAGAAVALLDRDGRRVALAESDGFGRFTLAPPRAGEFVVQVERLGYERTTSPLIAFAADGTAAVDFELRPLPIGLEGIEVEVESDAERLLEGYGLSRALLGNRWVGRSDIEAVASALRAKDVIRWAGVPGVQIREDNGSPGLAPLCVGFWRAKSLGSANPPCALTLLNGVRIDAVEANQITPNELESIAVLTPIEASFLFGTAGSAGAVMLWTRRGGS